MPVPRYPITMDGETTDIGTAAELVVALDVLQGQHDRQVLEQLRPHLPAIIAGPQGLLATLAVLSAGRPDLPHRRPGPALPRIVKDATALRDILATLAEPRVEERLLDTLGHAADAAHRLRGGAGRGPGMGLRRLRPPGAGPAGRRRTCDGCAWAATS